MVPSAAGCHATGRRGCRCRAQRACSAGAAGEPARADRGGEGCRSGCRSGGAPTGGRGAGAGSQHTRIAWRRQGAHPPASCAAMRPTAAGEVPSACFAACWRLLLALAGSSRRARPPPLTPDSWPPGLSPSCNSCCAVSRPSLLLHPPVTPGSWAPPGPLPPTAACLSNRCLQLCDWHRDSFFTVRDCRACQITTASRCIAWPAQVPAAPEPKRGKTHRDCLLEEMAVGAAHWVLFPFSWARLLAAFAYSRQMPRRCRLDSPAPVPAAHPPSVRWQQRPPTPAQGAGCPAALRCECRAPLAHSPADVWAPSRPPVRRPTVAC